ncbi:MAG TPA: glycosyltransferase family 39 protein, partial [Chloroflexota bacterium]|nr:glycosyltransferase family 39 protein [Chloroflexota bacterium]
MARGRIVAFIVLGAAGIGAFALSRTRREHSPAAVTHDPEIHRGVALDREITRPVWWKEATDVVSPIASSRVSRPVAGLTLDSDTVETPRPRSSTIGLVAWVVAVVAAFAAQRELTPLGAMVPAVVLYALASVLAVVGAILIDRSAPLPDPMRGLETDLSATSVKHPAWRRYSGAFLMAAGVVLIGASADIVGSRNTSAVALPLWVLALIVGTIGLCLWTTFPWRFRRSRPELLELLGVLAIMGLALAFRLPDLTGIPADVHGDEGAVGIAAREILTGQATNVFWLGWASLPELSFVASSLSMRVFGDDLFGLRMASVIQGCLSVGLLYAVAKRLFSVRVAALSAIVLAVSQMAVHFSRSGTIYIQSLFVSLLLFYFLLRGLSTSHPVDFLLAGFAAGLAPSVYYAARFALVVAFLYCLHRSIGESNFLRRQWRGLVVLVVGACLFLAPWSAVYGRDPMSFLARTSGVLILRSDNLAHEYDAYKVHSVLDVLRLQTINSLEAFNLRGETSEQYGQRGPLLDFWSGALFVLGAVLVTVRARQARFFLLASWFWLTLLFGSVFTVDALFAPHIVGMLGTIAILPALVVETGCRGLAGRFGSWGARCGVALAIAFFAVAARANYVDYFIVHATTMEQPNFFTVLSRYIQKVNGNYRIYLIADADTSLRYDTARFLAPDVDGVDVRNFPLHLPLDRVPSTKGVSFVDRSSS